MSMSVNRSAVAFFSLLVCTWSAQAMENKEPTNKDLNNELKNLRALNKQLENTINNHKNVNLKLANEKGNLQILVPKLQAEISQLQQKVAAPAQKDDSTQTELTLEQPVPTSKENLSTTNRNLTLYGGALIGIALAAIAVDCMESQVIKKTLRSWYKSIKRLIHQRPAKKQSGSAHPASKQHLSH